MSKLRHQHRRGTQRKLKKTAALNLVSLMDIFTILVFFLMVNSSEVEVLQTNSAIELPDSTSEKRPENQLVISVSADDVVVQGRPVARVNDAMVSDENIIEGLKQELDYQAQRKGVVPEGGHEITIMGDRELPYALLKKIMLTCQSSDFARISLAVNQLQVEAVPPPGNEADPAAADTPLPETAGLNRTGREA